MRRSVTTLFIATVLLTACGAPAGAPAAVSRTSTPASIAAQPSTQTFAAPTAPDGPLMAATATEAPTPTPASSPRWFWAISDGKNDILAFNASGQVNSVLDLTGIQHKGFEPLIRVRDDRAVAFFANSGKPRAFLLTSDSATPIQLPGVQVPIPGNGWEIAAQHGAYIVMAPIGTATTPAILINGETGQASLVAANVFGPTAIQYFVRFSADGQSLRFATGAGPVEVHNRDLNTGKDTTFFHSGSYLVTDSFGEIWYDYGRGTAVTAQGQPVKLKKSDVSTTIGFLDNGWILARKRDCLGPCPLEAYPSAGDAAALEYSLPVKLSPLLVMISGVEQLDQNRLLVSVLDSGAGDSLPAVWLLTPDGKSELLGKGLSLNSSTPYYRLPGLSDDNRYILLYPADGTSAFSIYDLTAGKALFSEKLDKPYAFLDVMYFAEGILVEEQSDTTHHWFYGSATGLTAEVNPPAGAGSCIAMAPDARPVCMTDSNVVVYDPRTGQATPLVQDPVVSLSN
jgi:hypothetical protein